MQKYIIGKKIGMTQLFDENGKFIPVTVIEAGPCIVTQKKTIENDGYEAVQIGYGEVTEKHLNKPMKGHFAKADVAAKKFLREFRADNCGEKNVGDLIKADTFAAGDKVDVCGISKGKGYQGVIKRFGAHSLKDTHGTGPVHRHAGSNGANSTPSRVYKGKILPGHMGVEQVTVQNLEVVKVDAENNLIALKGAIPGPKGGIVTIPGQPASGHSVHSDSRRGSRRWPQALETEGHRPCKTGFHPRSPVDTRWYRPGPEAPRLQLLAQPQGKASGYQVRFLHQGSGGEHHRCGQH